MKLVGKLQDGTVFVKKGHGDNEDDLFEFKTDEGMHIQSSFESIVYKIWDSFNLLFSKQSKLSRDWTGL